MPPLALLGGIPWRMVGALAAVLALAGLYFGVKHMGYLEADRDHQAQIATDNAKVGANIKADQVRIDGLASAARAGQASEHAKYEALRRKIANAKPSSCPLSPVLNDWLDGLPGTFDRAPAAAGQAGSPG